jgi:hypothetical protein
VKSWLMIRDFKLWMRGIDKDRSLYTGLEFEGDWCVVYVVSEVRKLASGLVIRVRVSEKRYRHA